MYMKILETNSFTTFNFAIIFFKNWDVHETKIRIKFKIWL